MLVFNNHNVASSKSTTTRVRFTVNYRCRLVLAPNSDWSTDHRTTFNQVQLSSVQCPTASDALRVRVCDCDWCNCSDAVGRQLQAGLLLQPQQQRLQYWPACWTSRTRSRQCYLRLNSISSASHNDMCNYVKVIYTSRLTCVQTTDGQTADVICNWKLTRKSWN